MFTSPHRIRCAGRFSRRRHRALSLGRLRPTPIAPRTQGQRATATDVPNPADEWEVRVIRRPVGVDLGLASAHTVRVLAEEGREVSRRRCEPTVDSLARVEAAALAGTPVGTVLEVVMEPTGPAWLPVAVFFTAREHRVFRVSSAKAADLRRFLSRHAKSNGIDPDTLARLPLVDPAGLHPLELPGAEAAALDRRVRVT